MDEKRHEHEGDLVVDLGDKIGIARANDIESRQT